MSLKRLIIVVSRALYRALYNLKHVACGGEHVFAKRRSESLFNQLRAGITAGAAV